MKSNYWLSAVMWNFWSWKTFRTFAESFEINKNNTFVIANVPYSTVDWFYSTPDDLLEVFNVLNAYVDISNENIKKYFDSEKNFKDILLIIDEAHLYLDSRSSLRKWNNLERMFRLFTQCRKRKIRIVFITQRLTQIDIIVRRLCDYVEEYHRWSAFGLYRVKKTVYENRWDIADIETDQTIRYTDSEMKTLKDDSKLYSEFVTPLTIWLQLFSLFDSSWRRMSKEEYETYFVCWAEDSRVNHFTLKEFIKAIYKTPKPVIIEDRRSFAEKYLPTFKWLYDKLFKTTMKVLDTQGSYKSYYSDDEKVENLKKSFWHRVLTARHKKAFQDSFYNGSKIDFDYNHSFNSNENLKQLFEQNHITEDLYTLSK